MLMKKIILLALSVLLLLGLAACGGGDADETVKVMVNCSEGVTVTSENPTYVKLGEDAHFEVSFEEGHAVDYLSEGEIVDGVLTLKGVTRRTLVNLTAIDLGYGTDAEYYYFFAGASSDTSSLANGAKVQAGTPVTVSANDDYRTFIGWSIGWRTNDTSKMISLDRSFTFRLSPELAGKSGVIKLFANYLDSDAFIYDPNGGVVNTSSFNAADNLYYSTELSAGCLKVTMAQSYREVFETVALFFDDGTFTREGYVLCEYNTKPDGSGTSYSLGSRYYPDPAAGGGKIYCIWKKASEEFTVADIDMPLPDGITADKAPDWRTSGVSILNYTADSEEVVIPEFIGGKPVIAISQDAFKNKKVKTLVIPKTVQRVYDGAIKGCDKLETIYYPDGIYYISDNALDAASYTSFKHLYVNATMAPRFSNTGEGAFSVKLSRLLASYKKNRIIVIAGSSTYQGLSSEYMEALLQGQYTLINFGTTRTTNGIIYLEAMQKLAHTGDIVLFAPENSTYMMGENELYWKTVRDLESMNNFWRLIDISNYKGVFSAFASFNSEYKYKRLPTFKQGSGQVPLRYEHAMVRIDKGEVNKYGEYLGKSDEVAYVDSYFITMNDMYKTKFESSWQNVEDQVKNKDYKDPNNVTWASILSSPFKENVNRAITSAKLSGAKVYFTFCPVDADKLFDECKSKSHLAAYDAMMANKDNFVFDGVLGKSASYTLDHAYFYDCAFHVNDTGRALRTYRMYVDICNLFGKTPRGFLSEGTSFAGCDFENGNSTGVPNIIPDYLK